MQNRLTYFLPLNDHPDNPVQTFGTGLDYSPLLIRQIEQCFGHDIPSNAAFKNFLNAINKTYTSLENEAGKLNRQVEIPDNEEYLNEIANQVSSMLFLIILQPDSVISIPYVSTGSTTLFELSPQRIMNNPDCLIRMLIDPDGERFEQAIRISATTMKPLTWESKLITASGKTKWIKANASPRRLSGGEILWKGVFIDITEKKSTSEEIIRQKKYYEAFLNYVPIDLAVFDPQHRYLYINQVAVKNEEVRQWMIGKDDFEYCLKRGKDISIAQGRRKTFLQAITERKEAEIEEILQDAEGKPFYTIKRYFPVYNKQQELEVVLAYGMNVTDTRKVEAKIREKEELMHSIDLNVEIGIYRSAPGSRMLYLNPALAQMFGFDSVEEVMQIPIETLYKHPEEYTRLLEDLKEHGRVSNRDIQFIRKDGSSFWGQVSTRQVLSQQQNIYYDTVIKDIHELRQADELLMEKNAELEKANAELDKFVYSASHELRAPLTSILGLISIAKMEEPAENQLYYLQMMEQSVNRLDKFIREIVHYSRNSRLEIQKEKIDFRSMTDEILKDLYYIEGVDKIRITTQICATIPFVSDAGRLKVIITNLISNAIRYHNLEKSNPYIKIQVTTNQEKAIIEVKDNGLGIDKLHQDKIFQMFYRASLHSKGSGIGLYIVKEMLAKLNGSIDLTSEPGIGSTFSVEVPQ